MPKKKPKQKIQQSLLADNTKFKLTISWKQAKPVYQHILKEMAKKIKTAGFRPGKMPLDLAEKKIGQTKIIEKALDQLLPSIYQEKLRKLGKKSLTYPRLKPLKLAKGRDWEIQAEIAEKPAIKLNNYQKLVKQAKKEAQQQLKGIKKSAKESKKTEQPKSKTGKPQLSQPSAEQQRKDLFLQAIFKGLITGIRPQLPRLLIEEETRREIEKLVSNLRQVNMSLDDYLKQRKTNLDQFTSELAAQVLGHWQLDFILTAIADREKITATKKEIKKKFTKLTKQTSQKKVTEVPAQYQDYLKKLIIRQKTLNHLLDI